MTEDTVQKRERRIKPFATGDVVEGPAPAALAGEKPGESLLPGGGLKAPFRADGVKVLDSEGRTVVITMHGALDARCETASRLAALMTANAKAV